MCYIFFNSDFHKCDDVHIALYLDPHIYVPCDFEYRHLVKSKQTLLARPGWPCCCTSSRPWMGLGWWNNPVCPCCDPIPGLWLHLVPSRNPGSTGMYFSYNHPNGQMVMFGWWSTGRLQWCTQNSYRKCMCPKIQFQPLINLFGFWVGTISNGMEPWGLNLITSWIGHL